MINQQALTWLQNAYSSNRLAQAYVVIGPPKYAGQEVAEYITQLLFCEQKDNLTPCKKCYGCLQAKAHTHPDLQWIEPEKKSRVISAEQARTLQQQIYKTPFVADWKVCVISGADRINVQAGNILLKTLEEPPDNSIFMLLTDSPQFLLSTIKSRCQTIVASTEQQQLSEEWLTPLLEILQKRPATGGVLTAFARADMISSLLKAAKDDAFSIEKKIAKDESKEESKDVIEARGSARYREIRAGLMRALILWYRDILILACSGDCNTLYYSEHKEILKKRAEKIPLKNAISNISIIEEINRQLERNMPEQKVMANGFCKVLG